MQKWVRTTGVYMVIGACINVEENGGGDTSSMKKDTEKLEGSSEGGNQEAGKVGERKGSKKAGEIEVVKSGDSGQSQKNSRRAEFGQNEVETPVKKSNAKVRMWPVLYISLAPLYIKCA